MADTETRYGVNAKVKMRLPVCIGAPGTADELWDSVAAGAAISGVSIVCGENICGADPRLELNSDGKVKKSPVMARRIEQYRRYHEGYGEVIVRIGADDARLGVPEYVVEQLGVEGIELMWSRGAHPIRDESRIDSLDRALELKSRGYVVTPDPSNPANQAAFEAGVLRRFELHSRLGLVEENGFIREVERLRKLGAKRVTLTTGASVPGDLAMVIEWAAEAELDLLTIVTASGGAGLDPRRAMEGRGVPLFCAQSMIHDLCGKLAAHGRFVPDIAISGELDSADQIFKALALGAPYVRAVCTHPAALISTMMGRDIGSWLESGPDGALYDLTVDEVSACCEGLLTKYGRETARRIPVGAAVLYAFCGKLTTGLQRLMADTQNARLSTISRDDLVVLTPEAAAVAGLSCAMPARSDETERAIRL